MAYCHPPSSLITIVPCGTYTLPKPFLLIQTRSDDVCRNSTTGWRCCVLMVLMRLYGLLRYILTSYYWLLARATSVVTIANSRVNGVVGVTHYGVSSRVNRVVGVSP